MRLDNTSGAIILTINAAKILERFSRSSRLPSNQFLRQLVAVSEQLIHSQPAMAGIFNLAHTVVKAACKNHALTPAEEAVRASQDFVKGLKVSLQAVTELTASLVKNGSVIVTHSFSSTVLRALMLARSHGRIFRVICTESRPMLEGVALARKLASARISATLVVDAAVFFHLPSADMVIIGADAVCRDGIVNKVGTLGIAQCARSNKVPVYALASSDKLFPAPAPAAMFGATAKAEISRTGAQQIAVPNILFDLTPFSLVHRVITERGLERTAAIRSRLRALRIHPLLRSTFVRS